MLLTVALQGHAPNRAIACHDPAHRFTANKCAINRLAVLVGANTTDLRH
jgi:hypothetical protein